MNCRNCAAPMEPVADLRYYQCRHCGTVQAPEAPAIDGVRIVGRPVDASTCPLCETALVSALLDDTFPIGHCERCRGISIARRSFAEAVVRLRARQTGPPTPPGASDPRELVRLTACPACRASMETRRYDGPGNIVFDACPACDLIWLDYGEIQRVVSAPGRDRGRG